MAANTHRIKMLNSDAKAEEVGKDTLDYLRNARLLDHYEVTELKAPVKPTELKPADTEKSTSEAAKTK